MLWYSLFFYSISYRYTHGMILLYKGVREKKYVSICCYAHTHAHSHIAHISTSCQPALSTSCRKRETSFPLVCTCYLLVDNTLFTRKCPCLVYVFRSCWSRRRRRRPGREGAAWSPCVSVTRPDYPRTFSTIIITLLVCTYIKFHTMPYRCSAWMADRFVALLMSDRSIGIQKTKKTRRSVTIKGWSHFWQ